ncbi:DUF3265 domain-containing protein [Vibrio sp. RM-41-2B]|nr:DUF3265 domain-containing protein [Vibrio sp. RM-41-2A]MCR9557003.1 DUF3265 domain-containing protein [Vibrio sp. RM-41-2B]
MVQAVCGSFGIACLTP